MKILFASSEAYPFSKTGGLADVSGSLPKALGKLGHEVYLVLPFYRTTKNSIKQLKKLNKPFNVELSGKKIQGDVWGGKVGKNVTVLLVENNHYFDREGLYGNENGDWPDNLERFAFFSKATIEICRLFNIKPEIIHCHDWQTALIPTYLRTVHKDDPQFQKASVVFTIHNLSYQGLFPREQWNMLGLDTSLFTPDYLEFWGKINLLKGGVIFADSVTTVSVKYSQEIQTEKFGCGLDGFLKTYKYKLTGITNGADYDDWDPANDPFIISNYSKRAMAGKAKCKASLQKRFKLTVKESTPVIGMVTRLTNQKGFDILTEAMSELFKKELQIVILGTGEQNYHELLKKYQVKYSTKMGLELAYDNKLAHQIEAGSDMFLMPSNFEPCGLNQMYSLRYGTIPIVTSVGGLDDTIKSFDPKAHEGNGFKIEEYTKEALIKAVNTAIAAFKNKSTWKELASRAMGYDFSWDHTALQYQKFFEVIRKNGPATTQNGKKIVEIHKDCEA